jgi:hypothetical protein
MVEGCAWWVVGVAGGGCVVSQLEVVMDSFIGRDRTWRGSWCDYAEC